MTNKVQKIRKEVEMVVNRRLNLLNGDYFDLNKEANGFSNEIMDIIDSLQEEPISKELEDAAIEICSEILKGETVIIDGYEYVVLSDAEECFKAGSKWQKEQNQSTIELAEDHAMLAGMEKMKENMMAKAIDGYVIEDIEEGNGDFLLSAEYIPKSVGLKDRQKVKVIVIKED